MKIHEYQAREFFIKYGIPTPDAGVAETKEEVYKIAKEMHRFRSVEGGRQVV